MSTLPRGHTPLEFMFGREIPIRLDLMIGPKAMSNYSKFVSDLVDTLEPEYCDARQSLQSSSASAERCI